jgi:hypothetical protein
MKGKGTSNPKASQYTIAQLPFKGSNLEGYWSEDRNGKPYYKALTSDCSTQFEAGSPVYIWFSTLSPFAGYWVVSELNNATVDNVFSYIEYNLNYYPIGNWGILSPNYFITGSWVGDCQS